MLGGDSPEIIKSSANIARAGTDPARDNAAVHPISTYRLVSAEICKAALALNMREEIGLIGCVRV